MAPRFEVDPTFPKPLPNGWYQGQTIGLWVDAQDHVWIVHRPDVLDAVEGAQPTPPTGECCKRRRRSSSSIRPGNLLRHWGGKDGPGYQWPDVEPRPQHRQQGQRLDWRQRRARTATS